MEAIQPGFEYMRNRSSTSKLIQIYVETRDHDVTIHELRDELNITLLTVINVVNRLDKQNVLTREGDTVRVL